MNQKSLSHISKAFSALLLLFPIACGGTGATNAEGEKRPPGSKDDGGGGAGGGASFLGGASGEGETVKPDVCDKSAKDDPDAEFLDTNCDGIDGDKSSAIFVSPVGDDDFAGTIEHPVASLAQAILLATSSKKDVYVCTATYPEKVAITGETPIRIYGGFACLDDWSRTKVAAEFTPATGVALEIVDVNASAFLSLIKFVSSDATDAGQSSVAARVVRSKNVTFDRVEFKAGAGFKGADGIAALTHKVPARDGEPGKDAPLGSTDVNLQMPPTATKTNIKCPTDGGATITTGAGSGGKGGNGFHKPQQLAPATGVLVKGVTGTGKAGVTGKPGLVGFGSIDVEGNYVASNNGEDGKFGDIGKTSSLIGGAGGSAVVALGDVSVPRVGGSGGSSGYAGCGGYPGNGGKAGGGSIAIVVVDSVVRFERGSIATGAGGVGGVSSEGSAGQTAGKGGIGGLGSTGHPNTRGGTGAAGTPGGKGGSGGAGAGGPSIGVVWSGTEPTFVGVTYDTGTGGLGAEGPAFNPVNGANGITQDVYEVAK